MLLRSRAARGCKFHFDISSVGVYGNMLMAATLAKGTTLITNAAIEPEITTLARMLVKMGARIEGIGTSILEIEGVESLNPVDFTNIPTGLKRFYSFYFQNTRTDASIRAPILTSIRARVVISGSIAALVIKVVPFASVAAISILPVAPTLDISKWNLQPRAARLRQ